MRRLSCSFFCLIWMLPILNGGRGWQIKAGQRAYSVIENSDTLITTFFLPSASEQQSLRSFSIFLVWNICLKQRCSHSALPVLRFITLGFLHILLTHRMMCTHIRIWYRPSICSCHKDPFVKCGLALWNIIHKFCQ